MKKFALYLAVTIFVFIGFVLFKLKAQLASEGVVLVHSNSFNPDPTIGEGVPYKEIEFPLLRVVGILIPTDSRIAYLTCETRDHLYLMEGYEVPRNILDLGLSQCANSYLLIIINGSGFELEISPSIQDEDIGNELW